MKWLSKAFPVALVATITLLSWIVVRQGDRIEHAETEILLLKRELRPVTQAHMPLLPPLQQQVQDLSRAQMVTQADLVSLRAVNYVLHQRVERLQESLAETAATPHQGARPGQAGPSAEQQPEPLGPNGGPLR